MVGVTSWSPFALVAVCGGEGVVSVVLGLGVLARGVLSHGLWWGVLRSRRHCRPLRDGGGGDLRRVRDDRRMLAKRLNGDDFLAFLVFGVVVAGERPREVEGRGEEGSVL